MLLPILGPITPYKRVCGAAVLLTIAIIAPYAKFVATLIWSHTAGNVAVYLSFAVLVTAMLSVRSQNISATAETAWLLFVAVFLVTNYAIGSQIRNAIAEAAGVFNGTSPGPQEPLLGSLRFHHAAGYRVDVPEDWTRRDHVDTNLTDFSLRNSGGVAAEFRPHCDLLASSVVAEVFQALEADGRVSHTCYRWHGFEACLMKRPQILGQQSGQRWEWLGKHAGAAHAVRLIFLLYQPTLSLQDQVLRIFASTAAEDPTTPNPMCATPLEWAEY
jgi:hypothetical protein